MKPPRRYMERLKYVEAKLGDSVICDRCQCTLATFAEKCATSLSDCCPGFMAIEAAKEEFDALNKSQLPSTLR